MKKFALAGATLVLAMAAGSAAAAGGKGEFGPAAGTFGLNVSVGTIADPLMDFVVSGKYFITKDMAVLAGAGLQFVDNGQASNNTSTSIGFTGGIRKYLKTEELAPFFGGQLQYVSARSGANDVTQFFLGAEAGAEYFLSRQFSLEGSVAAGYLSADIKPVGGGATTKTTAFGTFKGNLSVNYYY